MAYGRSGRGRRVSPREEERRERERKDYERFTRDRKRLDRLLRQFRKVPLKGEAARAAWALPEKRSYRLSRLSDGTVVQSIVRGDGRHLYLQEAHFPGWRFYKLVPRYHTPRATEVEGDPGKRRRARRSHQVVRAASALEERPLAVRGLKSYRLRGPYGFIMIGAEDDEGAMREAARSTPHPLRKNLEVWNGQKYVSTRTGEAEGDPRKRRARRDPASDWRGLSRASKDYLNAYASSSSRSEVAELWRRVPTRDHAAVRRLIEGERPAYSRATYY